MGLESNYHFTISNLGTTIQILQMFSFLLNPRLQHGETLGALSKIIYATQVPLWDMEYVGLSWAWYMPFFSLAVALILCLIGALFYVVLSNTPVSKDSWLISVLRVLLHSTSSILFIPLMQSFLSQMICKDGYLWTFPDQQCFVSSQTMVTFVMAIIAFVLLNLFTYITETTLYLDEYDTQHPLARKHYIMHALYAVWRTLSCILFNVFISNASTVDGYTYTWMPMYVCVSALLMAFAYAFFLPFINQRMTRIFTVTFLELSVLGILTFFSAGGSVHPATAYLFELNSFARLDVDGLLAFSCFCFIVLLGTRLADFRINPELKDSLPQLMDAAAPYPQRYTCMFPRGLPEYDSAYRTYIDLCNEVADGAFQDNRSSISLETPYLSTILCYTDVETSTRFLCTLHRLTGLYPTPEMLHLAAQIYVKGTLCYQESTMVILNFASMISSYTIKRSMALGQCERTNLMACTFPTRYRAYKLMTNLKYALHVRDTAYQRTCEEAKRAHKEILISLYQFWNKLLTQQDRAQLLTAYSMMAYKRERTNKMFLKALEDETNDHELLLKYADFLDQVMAQPERAEKLRSAAKHEADVQTRQAGQPVRARKSTFNVRLLSRAKAKGDDHSDGVCSVCLSSQNVLKIVILLVLLASSVGFLATTIVSRQKRWNALQSVEYSSTNRYLRPLGDMLALEYWSEGETFVAAAPRLFTLSAIAADYLSIHNELSFGRLASGPETTRGSYWRAPQIVRKVYASANSYQFSVSSILALGYDYAQFLNYVPGSIARNYTDRTTISDLEVSVVFRDIEDQSIREWASSALNMSVLLSRQWYTAETSVMTYLYAFFFTVSIVALVIYVELSLLESPVEVMKDSIISLFALIPRSKLQEITAAAKLRIETFDRGDVGDDDMTVMRMQESEAAGANTRVSLSSVDGAERGVGEQHTAEMETTEASEADVVEGDELQEDRALLWGDKHHDHNSQQLLRRGQHTEAGVSAAGTVPVEEENAKVGERDVNRYIAILALLGFLALVTTTTVIVSASLFPTLVSALNDQDATKDRLNLYLATQDSLLTAGFWMNAFFARGDDMSYTQWLTGMDEVKYGLPQALALSPVEAEVEYLRDAGAYTNYFIALQASAKVFYSNPSFTTSQYNTNLTIPIPTATGEAARKKLYTSNDNALLTAATSSLEALGSLETVLHDQFHISPKIRQVKALSSTLIALYSVAISCVILLAFLLFSNQHLTNYLTRVNTGLLASAFVSLMVALVIAVVSSKSVPALEKVRISYADVAWLHGQALKSYMWPLFLTGNIVQRGNTSSGSVIPCLDYFDYILNDHTWEEFADSITDTSTRATFYDNVNELLNLQSISLTMVAESKLVMVPLELVDFDWNFDTEVGAMDIRLQYPNDPLRYTTRVADLAESPENITLKAYDIISNDRVCDLVTSLHKIWESEYRDRVAQIDSKISDSARYMLVYVICLIVLNVVTLIMVSILVLFVIRVRSRRERERSGFSNESRPLSTGLWVGLLLILAFTVTVFALGLCEAATSGNRAPQLDLVNQRTFHVVDSMIALDLWWASSISEHELRQRLLFHYNALDSLRTQLIGGPNCIFGIDSKLDYFLQGENVELSPEFRYGFDPATVPNPLQKSDWTFSTGVEDGLAQWMQRSMSVVNALQNGTKEDVRISVEHQRNTVMPLVRAMDEAAHILLDYHRRKLAFTTVWLIVLAGLLIVSVLGMGLLVLAPVARAEAAEMMGFRMLLRLIPPDVREGIPAIREYMYSDGHYSQNSSSPKLNLSMEELAFPLIAMNRRGIVIKFNRHAESIFGYAAAEVLGNNISILMPERIGSRHNYYVQKYCDQHRPANRRVFTERSILARRKSGELFTVRLTVHEMRRGNGEGAFIGFLRDVHEQVKKQHEEDISRYIQQNATSPMIVIDSLGTILRFNTAAEECFGRKAAEVADKNVKILMPQDIAVRHDAYLATYLRTKKKHAIDNTTRSRGIRKTGEEFPIELKIKEVNTDGVTTYIGFCRDLTMDADLEESLLINDVILETSTTSIICTDLYGKIIYYSKYAELVFGYSANEVVNNNCKMLMPETTAENHDTFLERYRMSWTNHATPLMDREVVGRHKDGHLMPLLASFHEVRSSSSSHHAIVGFFRELSEARQLERSLRVEEVVVDSLQIPLVVINRKGIILLVNRSACVEFGYQEDELLHKNVKVLMPPNVAVHHDDYISRYLLTGVSSMMGASRRVNGRRKNGTTFSLEIRLREVRGDTEGDVHFIGFLRNIAKDIRLERQDAINQVAMDDSPIPLFSLDKNGFVLCANDAAGSMFQCALSKLQGLKFASLMEPEPNASSSPRASASSADSVLEFMGDSKRREVLRSDGTRLTVEVVVSAVEQDMETTDVRAFVACIRDMTEDGAIQQRSSRTERIGQMAPVPLLEFNRKGIIERFNVAAEQRFGYHASDVVGGHVNTLLASPAVLENLLKAPATVEFSLDLDPSHKEEMIRFRTEAVCKNGSTFPVEICLCELVRNQNLKANTYIAYFYELNDVNRLQAASMICRTYMSLSPHAIIVVNVDGVITAGNEALCRVFLYDSPSDLIGRNVTQLMTEEVAAVHQGYLLAYQKTGMAKRIGTTTSVQCKRSGGDMFSCSLTVEALGKGDQAVYVGRFVDGSDDGQVAHAKALQEVILSVVREALLIITEATVIQCANGAAEEMFGVEQNQLVGVSLVQFLPGVNITGGSRTFRKRAVTVHKGDGTSFDAELRTREVSLGEVRFFVVCVVDLAETNQLHAERKMNMAMLEHSPAPLLMMSKGGVISYISSAAESFFGVSATDVVGTNVAELLPAYTNPEDSGDEEDFRRRSLQHLLTSSVEGRMERAKVADGVQVPVEVCVRELPPQNGEQGGYMVVLQDRSGDFALERARDLSAALERGMPLPSLLLSASGVILRANAAAEAFLEYPAAEMVGRQVSMIVPFRDLFHLTTDGDGATEKSDTATAEADLEAGYYTKRNLRLLTKNGTVKEASARVCLTDGGGMTSKEAERFVLFVDHTATIEYRRARQRLDALVNSAKTCTMQVRPDTFLICNLNRAALRLLQCSETEGLERPLGDLLCDPKALRAVQAFAQSSAALSTEADRGTSASAKTLKILTTMRRLGATLGPSTEFTGEVTAEFFDGSLFLTVGDIDAQHRKQLHASLLASVESTVREAYMMVNEDDDIISINQAGRRLLGYTLTGPAGVLSSYQVVEGGIHSLFERDPPIGTREGDPEREEDRTIVLDMISDFPLAEFATGSAPSLSYVTNDETTTTLTRVELRSSTRMRTVPCRTADGRILPLQMRLCRVHIPWDAEDAGSGIGRSTRPILESPLQSRAPYLLVYLRDLSVQAQTLSQIELGEGLLEKNPTAIVVTTVEGIIMKFNAAAERLFHFDRSQVIGKNTALLMPEAVGSGHDTYLQNYLRTREQHVIGAPREVIAERRDGERFVAELNMLEVLDDNGDPYLFMGFFHDLKKPVPRQ